MKRPLSVIGLAFALAVRLSFLLEPEGMLLLSLAGALTGVLFLLPRRPRLAIAAMAVLSAAAGLCNGWLYHQRSVAPFQALDGETVAVQGIVEEAVFYSGSARYTLIADLPGEGVPGRQRLYLWIYGERELREGDMVQGQLRLRATSRQSSASQQWRGVRAGGYAVGELELADLPRFRLDRQVIRLRERLRANLYETLPAESAGLAAAMSLGQQGEVSDEAYRNMNRSGSVHLVSVSGLHLSVVAAFLHLLLRKAGISRRLRTLLVLGACFCFVILVGLSPSVFRAFCMLAVMSLADCLRRRPDSVNSLGMALLAICVAWPHWTLGQGIWYSFSATLGILLLGRRAGEWLRARYRPTGRRALDRLAEQALAALGISGAAYLFTLPLSVFFSGWISLVAPLTNVAIIPFAGIALVGGLLCACFGGMLFMIPVAWATHGCLLAILEIAAAMGSLPFATVSMDALWKQGWVLLATSLGGWLLYRGKRDRRAACALLAAVLLFGAGQLWQEAAGRSRVELVVLEGSNLTLLIRDRQAVVLGTPSQYDIGNLLGYLDYRNVREIPLVVAHDGGDRVGSGLLRLASERGLGCVVGPDDDYVLDQMGRALPGIPVYSAGYAEIEALSACRIAVHPETGEVVVALARGRIVKSSGNTAEYAIMDGQWGNGAWIGPGGEVEAFGVRPTPEPVGSTRFGAVRLVFRS